MTSVCVTIRESAHEAVLSKADRCRRAGAEMVEVRMDHLRVPEWKELHQRHLRDLGLKTILTLRPEHQGGLFKGSELDRASFMIKAMETAPDLVDLELDMDIERRADLLKIARSYGTGVIISHHDLSLTPPLKELKVLMTRCVDAGGDMVKLACMCNSPEDARSLLELSDHAAKERIRVAIMGMGVHGHITRVLAPKMGCEIVYASLDEPSVVDQLDIRTLERIWELAGLR